jgi:hypothetical protein
MSKNKFSVHVNPGECCVVIPIAWAHHIMDSYKAMLLDPRISDEESDSIQLFIELMNEWVQETAVEFYE